MLFVIAVLVLIIIILTIYIRSYRRQVKNICRQMAFHEKNETNLLITQDIFTKEMTELVKKINIMLSEEKEIRRSYYINSASLTETITNISHDIRTPLTSLDGYFQLLSESNDPEERAKYNKIISNRLTCLKDMLDELFTYTKLQNREYEIELTPMDINQLLCGTLFSFYDDIKAKGMEPEVNVPDKKVLVNCNEAAIRRIIQNVIKNGLEHGNRNMKISLDHDETTARIIIENQYINTGEIEVDRVFDRFYKANKSRSKSSTGLGLSIAKELVEKMNGTIAASVNGDYFSITINFPLCL